MADDGERLVVLLEARISEFEKRMKKAEQTGTGSYNRLRRGSRTATDQMEDDMVRSTSRINQALGSVSSSVGTFAKVFAGGLLAGGAVAAIEGLGRSTRETIRQIAEMGDEAKRAGMAVEAFQEWKFVAEQNRIGLDSVIDGFKELNLRADEWITTGSGPAADAFKRLGFTSTELAEQLKDPSALMLEIVGRLQGLDKAAQIRIADEIFGGTGGERFVELLSQGKQGLSDTIAEARNLGVVLDQEAIAKADALDRKFNAITASLSGLGKTFAVALAENFGLIDDIDNMMGGENSAKGQLGEELRQTLAENGVLLEKAKEDANEVRYIYQDLQRDVLATTRAIGDEIPNILGSGADNAEVLAIELADVTSQMDLLISEVVQGKRPASDLNTEMAGLIERAKAALAEASKIDGINLQNAIGQVDGLSGALSRALSWAAGVVDKMREAANMPAVGLGMDTGTPLSGTGTSLLPPGSEGMTTGTPLTGTGSDLLPPGKKTGGGRGGATSGGGASRIEQLMADLQTQSEIVDEWYQESLDLINNATDAQLEAIGGRHAAIERLEAEHRARMRGIEEEGEKGTLETMLGYGAQMLTGLGAINKKALKIGQAFAAAEAWVSTLKGAAKELEKGTFGFASAALVISKGAAFVAAIKGVSESGGSGSVGKGASTSTAPASASTPPATVNIQWVGSMAVDSMGSLTKKLNEEYKQGYRLNIVAGLG